MSLYLKLIKSVIIIFILSCFTLIYFKINSQNKIPSHPASISPSIKPLYECVLSFSPDILTTYPEQNQEVNINIDSQGKNPTLVQFEIAFNPDILEQISLSPGTMFSNSDIILNNKDGKNGRISYAVKLKPSSKPTNYSGTAAKLKFKVKKNLTFLETSIYFLPKTTIKSNNIDIPIKIAYGLKININNKKIQTYSPIPSK